MINFIFDLQRFDFSGGSGTETDPYKITTAEQLKEVVSNLNKHFKLMNDITLSGEWTPIGDGSNKFSGTFNGNDKTIIISNLIINSTSNYQGLFGFVGVNGTVINCKVSGTVNATKDSARVGGVVGHNAGTVSNCTVSGTVTATKDSARVGGVVGYNAGTVSNCEASVNVSGTGNEAQVGGVVGVSDKNGSISDSVYLGGTLTGGDNAQIGGVVGRNAGGTVRNCVATSVNASGTGEKARVGGVVGYNTANGSIFESVYLGGTLTGKNKGAIAGNNGGTFTDNYYHGTLANGVKDNGATQIFKLTAALPEGVTTADSNVVKINGANYIKAGDVTFTYDGNDYKYTVSEDITVTIKDSKLYVNDKLLGGGDSGDSGSTPDTEGLTFNNNAEKETDPEKAAKKTQQATSATLQSDFAGTLDTNNYRNLKTVKVATGFNNDIEIIGNRKANTISSGAGNDTLEGGYGKDVIDGGAGNDSLTGGTSRDTLTGGKGADTFVYNSGDGKDVITDYAPEDTIQITGTNIKRQSVNGKDVVIKIEGGGSLTLKKAVGKAVTVNEDGTEKTNIYRAEGLFDEDESTAEIWSTFKGTFKASDYKNLEVIDASNARNKLNIIANDKGDTIAGGIKGDTITGGKGGDSLNGGKGSDTLRGGAGDDTLTGGKGRNIFVYESGDDTITDFAAGSNRIQLLNGSVTTDYQINGDDLTLNFDGGSLTIENYDGKAIKFLDAKENVNEYIFTNEAIYNASRSRTTLRSGNSFTADNSIVRINASALDGNINISGNFRHNVIIGNDDGSTLDGGKGLDTIKGGAGNDIIIGGIGSDKLWGGGGRDTFLYEAGDGSDVIYDFTADDVLEINGVDEILPVYNSQNNSVKVKCGNGSITLNDFSATSLTINNDTWTLADNKFTKK